MGIPFLLILTWLTYVFCGSSPAVGIAYTLLIVAGLGTLLRRHGAEWGEPVSIPPPSLCSRWFSPAGWLSTSS